MIRLGSLRWSGGRSVTDPVAVIDAGYGSVNAVERALRWCGATVKVVREPGAVAGASGVILPGVGHFTEASQALEQDGWTPVLQAHCRAGRPLLGICLGMHLLFEGSEEGPGAGLGLLPGRICALPPRPRALHRGWDRPTWIRPVAALGDPTSGRFAFAHGFGCPGEHPAACGLLTLGEKTWAVAVAAGPVIGVQFHPEKSLEDGVRCLAAFARSCGQHLASRTWDV